MCLYFSDVTMHSASYVPYSEVEEELVLQISISFLMRVRSSCVRRSSTLFRKQPKKNTKRITIAFIIKGGATAEPSRGGEAADSKQTKYQCHFNDPLIHTNMAANELLYAIGTNDLRTAKKNSLSPVGWSHPYVCVCGLCRAGHTRKTCFLAEAYSAHLYI